MIAQLTVMEMENAYLGIVTASQDFWDQTALEIRALFYAVAMVNMKKVTACAGLGGKAQSVMFQRSSVLTPPALVAMGHASWGSVFVPQDTKEKYVKKRIVWTQRVLTMVYVYKESATALQAGEV